MKTVIALAIGIWLGRQLYLNYDVVRNVKKEERLRKRVTDLLTGNGIGKRDADALVAEAMNG
jgi:hypothetical protein